jgi:AraC-like DNA-binding protein
VGLDERLRQPHHTARMHLTQDLTECETVPDWARQIALDAGGFIASFGQVVITPLADHDCVETLFAGEETEAAGNSTERHFATILKIGAKAPTPGSKRLPALRITLGREHFEAVLREHFTGESIPQVQAHTFLRGTPHGRGIYTLAAALKSMVEQRADLLSRYCLEIALIKAIALAPPSMMDLQSKGTTWGPALRRVEKACQFMIQSTEEPFDLATVAAAAGSSERTLNEDFHRILKLTPLQFHRHCKLEAAYADLLQPDVSVTEIALKYGFQNLGRFARAFRERFGINPSEVTSP